MKHIVLVIMVIVLGAVAACAPALSPGDRTSDSAHAFSVLSAQIIDKIGGDVSPEGQSYLVIKYEVENLQSQNDRLRQWTDQIILEAYGERYELTFIKSLDNQLRETSLLQNQKKSGYIAFTVPGDAHDFKLTFIFPDSKSEVSYELKAQDKRVDKSVAYVITKLERIERVQRITLVGGIFAAVTSAPIRYLGVILVPEEEVSQLVEQTKDLSDNVKRKVIEDYLLAHGHCCLE